MVAGTAGVFLTVCFAVLFTDLLLCFFFSFDGVFLGFAGAF